MRWKLVAAGALTLLLVPPLQQAARAQGWTLPAGRTWVKVGFMVQSTSERYFFDGRRIPYFFEGHNRTLGFLLDARHGVTDRLEVDLQLPYFSIAFNDLAADRTTSGIGDLRLGVRYNWLSAPVVATLGATVKFPTGQFENDAEVVPVGEGQYDYEFTLELARSLWPLPGYVNGLIGYRFRSMNQETGIDHGDELFWSIEGGYVVLPRLWVKLVFRGMHGFKSTSFGFTIPSLQREVRYLEPGVIYELSRTRSLELSVPISLGGKNWPAGAILNIGVFQTF